MGTQVDTRRRLISVLEALGYDDSLREEAFPVWTRDTITTVDLVGFGASEPRDMTTATIAAVIAAGSPDIDLAVQAARTLAAPALLVASQTELALWSIGSESIERRGPTEWGDWPDAGRLTDELAPQRLLAAKRAQQQLALFPIDASLLTRSRRSTADGLAIRVEAAIHETTSDLPDSDAPHRSRLVVGALAALMVRDKLEAGQAHTSESVLDLAQARFPAYFAWLNSISTNERACLHKILEQLGTGVNYRSLDPALVSDVYEHALIDSTTRKQLSVFYTPPGVARALATATPVELVPPEDRIVLDLACGSGTLLLAMQDRLRLAASPAMEFDAAHTYLTEHVFGFDADPFAVEVAKLSLLLNALPVGNSWRVEQRPVEMGLPNDLPSVRFVVSNPPWVLAWDDEGKRLQTADRFVRASVEAVVEGGFVSLLLPASLFEGRSTRQTRHWLDERASLVEVTRLPENTFRHSKVEPAAVVLQRGGTRSFFLSRRALKRGDWRARLLDQGHPDVKVIVPSHAGLPENVLSHGPLDGIATESCVKLRDIAVVQTGPVPTPRFSDRKRAQGEFCWLPRAGNMPLFEEVHASEVRPTTYPSGFNWRVDDGEIYSQPKVLVSAIRTPANPWRLRVRFDSLGVIPRQSLRMVLPAEGSPATLEGLAAVLASAPAAAWVDQHNTSRSIRQEVMETMPVPALKAHWRDLHKLGKKCRDQVAAGQPPDPKLLLAIDELVMDALGLSRAAQSGVRSLLEGFQAPEDAHRYVAGNHNGVKSDSGPPLRAAGTVLSLDAERIRLWIAGVTPADGVWTTIPDRFPGALLYAGATFEATLVGGDLDTADYRLQRQSWKADEELLADVGT